MNSKEVGLMLFFVFISPSPPSITPRTEMTSMSLACGNKVQNIIEFWIQAFLLIQP